MDGSVRFRRPRRAIFIGAAAAVALVLSLGVASGPTAVGTNPDAILSVRAKGSTGAEQMEVRVASDSLAVFTVSQQWTDYQIDVPSAETATDVQVAFINDSEDPHDHNLWVDSVSYGGRTYEAEAETTFATGVWANGARCQPGYHQSQLLACGGYLGFGDLPGVDEADRTTVAEDAILISVFAAGETGEEQIELRIDGETVATFEPAASPDLDADPQFQEFRYVADRSVTADRVTLAFVNDRFEPGSDRNAWISSISVDGQSFGADAWDLTPSAAPHAGCSASWDARRVIGCNSVLSLGVDARSTVSSTQPEPAEAEARPTPTTGEDPVAVEATRSESVGSASQLDPSALRQSTIVDGFPAIEQPVLVVEEAAAPGGAAGTTAEPGSGIVPAPGAVAVPEFGPGSVATGRFYVVGTDIVDPDGNVFYPIGANVAIKFTPYGYVFEGGNGGVDDHLDDVRAWNWNTVRATLICDNATGVPSVRELVDGIAPTIERFTAAGIVVILECHDLTGTDPRPGSAAELGIRPFWDEIAVRYRDNPYVWFNPLNEPYATEDTTGWLSLHQFYVDRIRANGAENIIVADLPYWGQGIDLLAESSFADDLNQRCNTVFGWHAYGAINVAQGSVADHERSIQAAQAKGMALIVGEYGVAFPSQWGNAGPWQWNISGFEAMNVLGPRYGIGLLWWHATGDDAYFSLYALKNDRSGFWTAGNSGNLTPYGQQFWDVSHRVSHSGGPFTGDLSASNCGSAAR